MTANESDSMALAQKLVSIYDDTTNDSPISKKEIRAAFADLGLGEPPLNNERDLMNAMDTLRKNIKSPDNVVTVTATAPLPLPELNAPVEPILEQQQNTITINVFDDTKEGKLAEQKAEKLLNQFENCNDPISVKAVNATLKDLGFKSQISGKDQNELLAAMNTIRIAVNDWKDVHPETNVSPRGTGICATGGLEIK